MIVERFHISLFVFAIGSLGLGLEYKNIGLGFCLIIYSILASLFLIVNYLPKKK